MFTLWHRSLTTESILHIQEQNLKCTGLSTYRLLFVVNKFLSDSREEGLNLGSCSGGFSPSSLDYVVAGLVCSEAEHYGRKHGVNQVAYLIDDRKHRERQRKGPEVDIPYRAPLSPPCDSDLSN